MGSLSYGGTQSFEFEDRLLAHLRSVITMKLVRHESFMFTWNEGTVQRTVWLHPSSQLVFEFDSTEGLGLNREWVERLSDLANGPSGLHIVEEPRVP
ncbi:hypothetical protein [Leucobacter luti]|uniref:DUF7882 family protein n=1 Tax=Leucobacter luti TaxID=340320 RepID=UPI003D00CC79